MIKLFAKSIVTKILWWQVNKLLKTNNVKVIGVVGSIGKTSTKYAVAQTLQTKRKVRWQEGNYNDLSIVPLVFFGHDIPSLFNPIEWTRLFLNNHSQLKNYPYEIVVLELGTDGPGQIKEFGKYIKLDLAIVTAVAPEHMEYFITLDSVAEEELSVMDYSKQVILNKDLVDAKYIKKHKHLITYGTNDADYVIKNSKKLNISKNKKTLVNARRVLSSEIAYSKAAAAVVADIFGFNQNEILNAFDNLNGAPGRLQILKGLKGSTIIDDTYNSSPSAVIASLIMLYSFKAKNKIAILGSMNELGESSKSAHEKVGLFCSSSQLNLVVTVGDEANKYLSSAAKKNGCEVKTFSNPYDAGEFVKSQLKPSTAILVKGSQSNVYLEEAVKVLLANMADSKKLVRQSGDWQSKKQQKLQGSIDN